MLTAIIAGIITAAIIVCIVLIVFYFMRERRSKIGPSVKGSVNHLETIGFATSESSDDQAGSSGSDVRVKTGEESLSKPSDMLSNRFAAFGVFVAAVFATLGAKIWSMQLLKNSDYSSEAEKNLYSTVSTPAPRGCIYDRNGRVLVRNRTSQTLLADADVSEKPNVIKRLSAVLGIPTGVIRQRVRDESLGAQNQRIVESDVRLRDIAFISEHPDAFEGISVEERTVREYPYGALASHVLGYIGSPTEEELALKVDGRDVISTDVIGKSGVELSYDSILAGDKGQRRVMVDASGDVVNIVSETEAAKGSDLHLTIDAHAQSVADKLLAETIATKGDIGTGTGVCGSIVALDVTDGSVLVMSSYPTFDPSYLIDGIPQDMWDLYNSEESHSPFMNRAINGEYAAASTFKAFTSMAGLNYGFANFGSSWHCTGEWDGFGSGDIQKCWKTSGHGDLDLHGGIVNSCDVVFYEIAKAFYDHGPDGTGELSEIALQDYVKMYNFGSKTGIDLENESLGRVPTPAWKKEQWKNVPSEASWRGGDYSNIIIGQGDILVTPLQVAVGYEAIATGKMMKPHLMKEIKNSKGETVVAAEAEVLGEPEMNEEHLAYVRNSLHDMIASNNMLNRLFTEYGIDAAGKSGTAEHTDRPDDAWFVAYAPYDNPKYVVACMIEQGSAGSDVSGPIVAEVLKALMKDEGMDAEKVDYIKGSSGKSIARKFTGNSGRTD